MTFFLTIKLLSPIIALSLHRRLPVKTNLVPYSIAKSPATLQKKPRTCLYFKVQNRPQNNLCLYHAQATPSPPR